MSLPGEIFIWHNTCYGYIFMESRISINLKLMRMSNIFSKLSEALSGRTVPFGFRRTSLHTYMIYYRDACIKVYDSDRQSVTVMAGNVPLPNQSFDVPNPQNMTGEQILQYIDNQIEEGFGSLIRKAISQDEDSSVSQ